MINFSLTGDIELTNSDGSISTYPSEDFDACIRSINVDARNQQLSVTIGLVNKQSGSISSWSCREVFTKDERTINLEEDSVYAQVIAMESGTRVIPSYADAELFFQSIGTLSASGQSYFESLIDPFYKTKLSFIAKPYNS